MISSSGLRSAEGRETLKFLKTWIPTRTARYTSLWWTIGSLFRNFSRRHSKALKPKDAGVGFSHRAPPLAKLRKPQQPLEIDLSRRIQRRTVYRNQFCGQWHLPYRGYLTSQMLGLPGDPMITMQVGFLQSGTKFLTFFLVTIIHPSKTQRTSLTVSSPLHYL